VASEELLEAGRDDNRSMDFVVEFKVNLEAVIRPHRISTIDLTCEHLLILRRLINGIETPTTDKRPVYRVMACLDLLSRVIGVMLVLSTLHKLLSRRFLGCELSEFAALVFNLLPHDQDDVDNKHKEQYSCVPGHNMIAFAFVIVVILLFGPKSIRRYSTSHSDKNVPRVRKLTSGQILCVQSPWLEVYVKSGRGDINRGIQTQGNYQRSWTGPNTCWISTQIIRNLGAFDYISATLRHNLLMNFFWEV
jgi:hypothetical protein